jgi:hypothetical protein
MDPQKLSKLDPKLRDAYQRVMGTPIPEPQVQPIQAQTPPPPGGPIPDPAPTPPMPQPEPPIPPPSSEPTPTIQEPPTAPEPLIQPPVSEPQPTIPTESPAIPAPEPAIPPQQPPAQADNFVQMNSEVASAQSTAIKKKNGMMPILIGAAGLVFIVIYTLFWTKIFNFKLPFLP